MTAGISEGLTVRAPDGAHFNYDEVKTARGTQSLGDVPLLEWDDLDKAREFYGDQGVLNVVNGTSLIVSFQGIARRMRIAGKSDDEIAEAQIKFRPGAKAVGVSTPVSRARGMAAKAVEAGADGDELAAFLKALAEGRVTLPSVD
jgi:hypothetical protein